MGFCNEEAWMEGMRWFRFRSEWEGGRKAWKSVFCFEEQSRFFSSSSLRQWDLSVLENLRIWSWELFFFFVWYKRSDILQMSRYLWVILVSLGALCIYYRKKENPIQFSLLLWITSYRSTVWLYENYSILWILDYTVQSDILFKKCNDTSLSGIPVVQSTMSIHELFRYK